MTYPSETFADELRGWAADYLKVAPDAPRAEVHAAFLRLVHEHNFVPDLAVQQAFAILTGQSNPAHPPEQAMYDLEQRLQTEVDTFAGQFFTLPVPYRGQRWQELRNRCKPMVRLEERLKRLRLGLKIDLAAIHSADEPRLARLAQMAGELFVLRPEQRALRRDELFQESRDQPKLWSRAATRFRLKFAEAAKLEKELLDRLEGWQWGARAGTEAGTVYQGNLRIGSQPPPVPAKENGSKALGWGAIFVVAIIVRLLISLGTTNKQPPLPNINPQDIPEALKRFQELPPDRFNNPGFKFKVQPNGKVELDLDPPVVPEQVKPAGKGADPPPAPKPRGRP